MTACRTAIQWGRSKSCELLGFGVLSVTQVTGPGGENTQGPWCSLGLGILGVLGWDGAK